MRHGQKALETHHFFPMIGVSPPSLTSSFSFSLALSLLGACTPPQSPAPPTISLRVRGTPASATVIIDEEALGTLDFVAAHGVALPPGIHHVTVKAMGYFPSDTEVDARPGSPPVRLEVALTPVPD